MKPKLVSNGPRISVNAVLEALQQRLKELNVRRDAITKQILAVEKNTGGEAPAFGQAREAIARAMLEGEPYQAPPANQHSVLQILMTERATIDYALKIGNSDFEKLFIQRASEIYSEHFPEIAALEKRRVLLALELQSVNRAREHLREKIHAAGAPQYLPTDGVDLLGVGDTADETHWALNRVVADGIVTRIEIEDMRNG